MRAHLTDAPVRFPRPVGIHVVRWDGYPAAPRRTRFQQSAIYEFTYTAKNPVVAGLGLAATRDFVSFLRYATADDFGNANPLAGHVHHAYTFTVSQPARYLNDFQTLGFNEDEAGRRVIDGILNWLGAGNGVGINFRFAQTARTERNRQNTAIPRPTSPLRTPCSQTRTRGRREVAAARCAAPARVPKPWR